MNHTLMSPIISFNTQQNWALGGVPQASYIFSEYIS